MDGPAGGIGKLLPKALKEKRRRKREVEAPLADTASSTDDALSRTDRTDSQSSQPPREERTSSGRHTTETDASFDESNNYLVAYDSNPQTTLTRPAVVSTHPSQIGYLTTSSSLVQAAHKPASHAFLSQDPNPSPLPAQSVADDDRLEPTQEGHAHHRLLPKRSSSASRLRGVLRAKKIAASTSNSSPEEPSAPAVDRGSLGSDLAPAAVIVPDADHDTSNQGHSSTKQQRLGDVSRPQKLGTTNVRPTTPNNSETAPVIVNTPPTPTEASLSRISSSPKSNASSPGGMKSQRRGRAGSESLRPSKLSSITSAPLTPPVDDLRPATSSNTTPNFLSSMISAVQNTANTLSNSINTNITPGNGKTPSTSQQGSSEQLARQDNIVAVESSPDATLASSMEQKEPAVKTLGLGDLSLSQLGIMESNAPTPVAARFFDGDKGRYRSDSAPVESGQVATETSMDQTHRPQSLNDSAANGDKTPPTASLDEKKTDIQRSSSIRSAIGRRRKRGSSAATGGTGTTIGAAIAAANASVARPSAQVSAPRLTGFAVATKKRNRDFHNLFKSVPDDDYLIEDYSCAIQREILAHGRLYVSEGHLCFSSNIFGWVTTLVIGFDEIVAVEKRSTALVFKNGLEISTLHAKHIFASFASRDTTYDLIVKIWKLRHPNIKSSLNGVRLDETGGDRTEKLEVESVSVGGSQSTSSSDDEDDLEDEDIYDEDEEDEEVPDVTQSAEAPALELSSEKAPTRKPSGAILANGGAENKDDAALPAAGADFPGPATHAPTDCGDVASHYDKVLGDEIIPAPLGKVYSLLFGPQSAAWLGRWLTVEQKCTDFQLEDKRGLTEDVRSRTLSFIKPLNAAIGPKQTKCIVNEALENFDLERSVNILATTQNPDVPSGNVFNVKTRYCLSWAENNQTRIQINCTIEWTGKSWLKGPIEKGANEGQGQYCRDIFAALKAAVSARKPGAAVNGAVVKGKKKGKKGKSAQTSSPTSDHEHVVKPSVTSWGVFDPLQPVVGPVFDALKPLLTGNMVYGLLVGLLVATWFGFGTNRQATGVPDGRRDLLSHANDPQRLAAYEEMWLREESELWDWLEERVGLERLGRDGPPRQTRPKKGAVPAKERLVEDKLFAEKLDEREVMEAIRVTEERLRTLKSAVERRAEARGEAHTQSEGQAGGAHAMTQ